MKLEIVSTSNVILRCIRLCDNLHDVSAVLKFIDNLVSVKEFPDSTPTERLDAMQLLLSAYFKKYDELSNKQDEEEMDLKAGSIHHQ